MPRGPQLYWKETPRQVLSCEICEIFKNTHFEEHLQTTMQVLIHSLNLQKEILFLIYVGNWFHICGPRAATLLLPILVVVLRTDPLSANPSKWSNILKQFVSSSVFDHFLWLALTRLTIISNGFSFKKCFVNFLLKELQTISTYSFYLLCNHVATSTKSKLFVTYTFVYP